MEFVLFWLGLSIVVGVAANSRGRNPVGWTLLAILISPLLAGLLVLALGGERKPHNGGSTFYDPKVGYRTPPPPSMMGKKKCPDCAEEVLADARICKHCRHQFSDGITASRTASQPRSR